MDSQSAGVKMTNSSGYVGEWRKKAYHHSWLHKEK
jgi:hypothetical protein